MSIKCGNHNGLDIRHETVADVRYCYQYGPVADFAPTTEGVRSPISGTPDADRWSSADRERAQFMADRDRRPVDRSQNLPADVQAQAHRDAYGRPARVFQGAQNRPDRAKVTQDGMYRNPVTGEIHKVQFPREAPGDVKRLYASLLVVDTEPVVGDDDGVITPGKRHWTYIGGASKVVRPDWRLSVDEAKTLGALYGTCVYGHALTKEESIRKGIGPVCEEKYGMPA